MADRWKLSGIYFEACNCEAVCPCFFLSPPTTGECTVFVGWHIEDGAFDGVDLGGLNVAMAVHSPGHMAEVKWNAALYLDNKANDAQAAALTQIFGGQAGGHPALLASHVGNVLGVSRLAIDFAADGKKRAITIPNVADIGIEAVPGQGGGDISVAGHPLCIAPGEPGTVARSSKLTYSDHGQSWEITGKNGFFSPFSYAGP